MSEVLKTFTQKLNDPKTNGGEAFTVKVEYIDNGDHDNNSVFTNVEFNLQSYGNEAKFVISDMGRSPAQVFYELAKSLEKIELEILLDK